MSLTDKMNGFMEAVKKTREYIELKQAQSLIHQNPMLKKKVDEVIKKQRELLVQNKLEQEKLNAKILEVNDEFKKIAMIPEVNRYFAAGNNFNNMMSKIFKTINDSIQSDLKRS